MGNCEIASIARRLTGEDVRHLNRQVSRFYNTPPVVAHVN